MWKMVEKEIKGIIETLQRYEQSEISLNETLTQIKEICEVK